MLLQIPLDYEVPPFAVKKGYATTLKPVFMPNTEAQ